MLAPSSVCGQAPTPATSLVTSITAAVPQAKGRDGQAAEAGIVIEGSWQAKSPAAGQPAEHSWQGTVTNRTAQSVTLSEIVLADVEHGLPNSSPIYGEGFTMLAQTGGTLANPVDEGFYPDRSHYRIPEPEGLRTVYGLLTLQPTPDEHLVLAFTSCKRFIGRLSFSATRLRISLDLENLELPAGASWRLENLLVSRGARRSELLEQLAERIQAHHAPIFRAPLPTGWCSWYCFGPDVTAEQIRGNLLWAQKHFPQLRTIQIDDGYQPWMGDWLETGNSFGGDVRAVIREIKELGFEPAIWVAPMIASPQSKLFREHPEWFVQDAEGRPMPSDRVGFGGWRLGPWYALDGTHPGAQQYLEDLFRTLREEWGCTYFKLDATYWAALHGGVHHDRQATRIEAYRRAMEAIRRGSGESFLLGCNHPMWPSFGLIHGSRSSMDITRDWHHISKTGRENLLRGWQNGKLWWNDPDCLVLNRNQGPLGESDRPLFQFHATLIYATGGMLLTGDDMRTYGEREREQLAKLYPPTGRCMEFADTQFTVGVLKQPAATMVALFRWDDTPAELELPIERPSEVIDYWTHESLGVHRGPLRIQLPEPRTARLFKIVPQSP